MDKKINITPEILDKMYSEYIITREVRFLDIYEGTVSFLDSQRIGTLAYINEKSIIGYSQVHDEDTSRISNMIGKYLAIIRLASIDDQSLVPGFIKYIINTHQDLVNSKVRPKYDLVKLMEGLDRVNGELFTNKIRKCCVIKDSNGKQVVRYLSK